MVSNAAEARKYIAVAHVACPGTSARKKDVSQLQRDLERYCVWILPVPRIYNLALLEDIYIEHTSPCLNKIWDDLRYHVFPATQSCMTPENRSYLIETIYSRHRAVQTTRPRLDTISMVSMVEGGLDKAEAQSNARTRLKLKVESFTSSEGLLPLA